MTILPFKVFHNTNYLANILLFAAVARIFRITIDTDINSTINVQLDAGTRIKFKQCSRGIYYYDTNNMENNTTNNQVTNYTFMNTAECNKSYLHSREIKVSDEARIIQQLVVWPSTQALKRAIGENQIRNFPIIIYYINREEAIYEPQIPIFQVKAIRRSPEYHNTTPRIPLPTPIYKHHHNV